MGNWIFVLVVALIAFLAGRHTAPKARTSGTGRSETTDAKADDPKERTR